MALRKEAALAASLLAWLGATAPAAAEPSDQDCQGCYLGRDGQLRDARAEYARRLEERDPHHLRTILEEAAVLAVGVVWYWADRDRNLADWDYPSWQQRFSGEAWRLDNNEFPINFVAHPLNGATFYVLPRLNDHGAVVSSAYALGTSFAWEFLFEFQEKVSINDLLVTQGAGIPIGEFANKIFRYFNGIPSNAAAGKKAVAATLGFPRWIHRVADDDPGAVEGPYDEHGYADAIGKSLFAGYRLRLHDFGDGRVVTHGFGLGGRLSSLPGEGRPGAFALFFHEADVVTLSLEAGVGDRAREIELDSDMHLLGLYAQRIDRQGDGHAGVVGLNLAYRYRFQDFDGYNDRVGVLHLPAPGGDYRFRAGPFQLSSRWRFNGDFVGLHAPAYGAWADAHVGERDRPKSILRKHGYYYGWGVSTRVGIQVALPPFDLGAEGFLGAYDSQEGLDRTQEELTVDPDSGDRLLELEAELGFRVPSTPLRLSLGWSSHDRWSFVEEKTARARLETLRFGVEGLL